MKPLHPARLRHGALAMLFALLSLQGALLLAARTLGGAGDRVHPALHLVSGLVGLVLLPQPHAQRLYAAAFGAGYLSLGLAGAFAGFSPNWLPLAGADHTFHVVLGGLVAGIALWGGRHG